MYFPYLRGKQYDLIAVRDLVEEGLINDRIIPIFEPINLTSTLISTIKTCVDNNKKIAVIHNPQVGIFQSKFTDTKEGEIKNEFNNLMEKKNVLYAHILNKNSEFELKNLSNMGIDINEILVIHKKIDYTDFYNRYFNESPAYNLVPDNSLFRRRVRDNIVLLVDSFPKQQKNVDYLNVDDSIFSDNHLYFDAEGYKGFSDYSIIGEEYIDSGFAPMAVAIHIVYFNEKNVLKIKHFVSDSNTGIEDPAGKYYEALSKLIEWEKSSREKGIKVETKAMDEFRKRHKEESYPGLGYLKKLTIKHHLELMNKFLNGSEM